MLKLNYSDKNILEAGVDEAGRGCLAGPVFAAAVILKKDFSDERIQDSKSLTFDERMEAREIILQNVIAYGIAFSTEEEIDRINILNASFLAMHRAIDRMKKKPKLLLIDGNRFRPRVLGVPHVCIVKGDAQYQSIAAASILAKTFRDEWMLSLHENYPAYKWNQNKGYATSQHRKIIFEVGLSPYHRKTFCHGEQLEMEFICGQ